MELTWKQIEEIAQATVGQRINPLWRQMRERRLTASCFGKALKAMHTSDPAAINKFRDELFTPKDLSTMPPIKWGIEHEQQAIAAYAKQTGYTVKDTGLWLLPDGELGASPDGVVYLGAQAVGILEVKCPFGIRSMNPIREVDFIRLLSYLVFPKGVQREHDYYHQIQGEIVATGAPWCDFFIWTPYGNITIRVLPDLEWRSVELNQLINFYKTRVLRPEDRALIRSYKQVVEPMQVDVSAPEICPDFVSNPQIPMSAIISVLRLHLARWIRLLNLAENRPWNAACDHFYVSAKERICPTCLNTLLLHLTQSHPEHSMSTASVPSFEWSSYFQNPFADLLILFQLHNLANDPLILSPPCTCLDYPMSML